MSGDQPIEGRRWVFMSMSACSHVRLEYAMIGALAQFSVLIVCGYAILTVGGDCVNLPFPNNDHTRNQMTEPMELLPDWAARLAIGDEFSTVGALLPTRDGRRSGNGTVMAVEEVDLSDIGLSNREAVMTVVTDAGNMMRLTIKECEELFYPPKYIKHVTRDEKS